MEINLIKTKSNEKEILEMILQFLYDNRYIESAKLLESKANIIYDQDEIYKLKCLLKNHKFDESVKFLENSNFENMQKAEVLKILKSRKFIELVKKGIYEDGSSGNLNTTIEALEYLRKEISPIFNDANTLNKYSVMLFHKEKENFEKILKQNFKEIQSDELLIRKIQSLLCLSLDSNGNRILPDSRLEHLINSYIEMDVEMTDLSSDFETEHKNLQNRKNYEINLNFSYNLIIEKHDDEIWYMELTQSLKYLATCARNGMIAIYRINYGQDEVGNLHQIKIECISYFLAHKKYLTSIQWSKSEKYLLTSSTDKSIKLFDPFEGKCLKTYLLHTDIVSSIKWLNDETFVSGGIDKKMIVCTTGNRVLCSETFSRIRKVLLSEALNCLVIIPASMNDIIFYDHRNFNEINRITEFDPIISSNLSMKDDGRYLITNISKVNASINLYDLSSFTLVNKYYGHTQEQYTLECSFAGSNDEYIICGSEDASVYIWHRSSSIAVSVVKGHTGSVNNCLLSFYKSEGGLNNLGSHGSIENSPESHGVVYPYEQKFPFILSVSDDYTLRVWTSNSNTEVLYEDLTIKKKNRKLSEMFRANSNENSNFNINEYYNLIDDEHSSSSENSNNAAESDESD